MNQQTEVYEVTYSRSRVFSKKKNRVAHSTNSTPKPETPISENSGGSRKEPAEAGIRSQCFRKARTQVWAGRSLNSLSVRVLCCRGRVCAYGKNASSIPRPAPPGRNVKATALPAPGN